MSLHELVDQRTQLLASRREGVAIGGWVVPQQSAPEQIARVGVDSLGRDAELAGHFARRPIAATLAYEEQDVELQHRVNVSTNEPDQGSRKRERSQENRSGRRERARSEL